MTWKPTDHLNHALALVDQIETDAQACGVSFLPALKWRMAQVVSEALATAENNGRVASEIDVIAAKYRDQNLAGVPHVTITNGDATVTMGTTTVQSAVDAGYAHTVSQAEIYPDVDPVTAHYVETHPANYTPPDVAREYKYVPPWPRFTPTQSKRGRGRPKGAKGKKKKARKPLAMPLNPPANPEASS